MGFAGLDFGVTVLIVVVVNSVVIEFVSMFFRCFFAGACCLFMVVCPVAACGCFVGGLVVAMLVGRVWRCLAFECVCGWLIVAVAL